MDFYNFIKTIDADIIFLSETWCMTKCTLFDTIMSNYENIYVPATKIQNNTGRAKGGLLLSYKKSTTTIINIITTANTIICNVNTDSGLTTLFLVYAPPDPQGDVILKEILEKAEETDNFILAGDVNGRIGDFYSQRNHIFYKGRLRISILIKEEKH
jgi:hypothetical protein